MNSLVPDRFIDTHCHLDYLKAMPCEDILKGAQKAQVEKVVTISVTPDNLDTVIQISSNFTQVYCTQGVHPHDAKDFGPEVIKRIKENILAHSKVVAIGEIGLDYHYNNSPRDVQLKAFEEQLELASQLNLPVVIHTREADEDTLSILKNMLPKLSRKGVLHSFTSGVQLAQFAFENGFYIGFNGIITFKKADNVRDVLKMVPIENILFETDAPFLAPVPHRGHENTPAYVPLVAQQVALVKKVPDSHALFSRVYQNSLKLFGL